MLNGGRHYCNALSTGQSQLKTTSHIVPVYLLSQVSMRPEIREKYQPGEFLSEEIRHAWVRWSDSTKDKEEIRLTSTAY